MCLSTVYYSDDTERENPLAEDIANVSIADGHVVLTDLFGIDLQVDGEIDYVDLIKNYMTIKKA